MIHQDVEEAIAQMRRGVARLEPEEMRKIIGDDDARAITAELRVNTTLTELLLRNNSIGDAGAASLAEALEVNTALTVLNLNNNYIGGAGSVGFGVIQKWFINIYKRDGVSEIN
jgi:hypothetical protein